MVGTFRIRLLGSATACAVAAGCGSQVVSPGPPAAIRQAPQPTAAATLGVPARPAALKARKQQSGDAAAGVPRVPASSLVSLPAEKEAVYHRVVRGDTLSGIARQYGVSVGQLLETNGLDAETPLQPDQLIFIPKDF